MVLAPEQLRTYPDIAKRSFCVGGIVWLRCYSNQSFAVSKIIKPVSKQKEGKKRMKQVGRIEVPQEAFLSVLQIGDGDA